MPGFIILIICSNESFCLSVTDVHGSSKNFNWDSDFHSKLEFCGIPTYDELSIYVSEIDLIHEPFSIAYPLVSDTVSEQAYETLNSHVTKRTHPDVTAWHWSAKIYFITYYA